MGSSVSNASHNNWPFGELEPHHYRTIAIDPPCRFAAGTKSRPQHYKRMTDAEIAALPIKQLVEMAPRELWGEAADPTVKVSIEAFEPYLTPA